MDKGVGGWMDECAHAPNWTQHFLPTLGCIYIRAKGKAKATSLPICCIVSSLRVYTTEMCQRQKIKEKIAFALL